jgi:hypothetical protein
MGDGARALEVGEGDALTRLEQLVRMLLAGCLATTAAGRAGRVLEGGRPGGVARPQERGRLVQPTVMS